MIKGDRQIVVKAKINDDIVVINLASKNKYAYAHIQDRIEYLGSGTYYSFDQTLAKDTELYHFWKWKTQK